MTPELSPGRPASTAVSSSGAVLPLTSRCQWADSVFLLGMFLAGGVMCLCPLPILQSECSSFSY